MNESTRPSDVPEMKDEGVWLRDSLTVSAWGESTLNLNSVRGVKSSQAQNASQDPPLVIASV